MGRWRRTLYILYLEILAAGKESLEWPRWTRTCVMSLYQLYQVPTRQASCQHPLRTRNKTFNASEILLSIRKPVPFGTGNSPEGYKQTNLKKPFVPLGFKEGCIQISASQKNEEVFQTNQDWLKAWEDSERMALNPVTALKVLTKSELKIQNGQNGYECS